VFTHTHITRRALLADEMGLGKTVQATAAAAAYVSDWPLLVACPAAARLHWREELLRWLTLTLTLTLTLALTLTLTLALTLTLTLTPNP